jgi:hypothetical protein
MSENTKIKPFYVATINHRHGVDFYASRTEARLKTAVADWCREWWSEASDEAMPEKDEDVIEKYFALKEDEHFDMTAVTFVEDEEHA